MRRADLETVQGLVEARVGADARIGEGLPGETERVLLVMLVELRAARPVIEAARRLAEVNSAVAPTPSRTDPGDPRQETIEELVAALSSYDAIEWYEHG